MSSDRGPALVDSGEIDPWVVGRYVALGLMLGLAGDITDQSPLFGVFQVVLLLVALSIGFLPTRLGLVLLLAVAISCRDLAQTSSEALDFGRFSIASPWQTQIGFVRPSWLITLSMILLIMRNPIYIGDRTVVRAGTWFATVPLVTGLVYGGLTGPHAAIQVPVDLKMPLLILISILLYRSYLRRHPQFTSTLIAVLIGTSLARALVDLVYWSLDMGSALAGVSRVSVDSTKGTAVLLVLLGVYLIVSRRSVVLGAILGVGASILLAVYVTRMLWLTALLGVVVILVAERSSKKLLVVPVAAFLFFFGLQLIGTLNPDSMRLLEYRSNTLVSSSGSLESVDFVRYAEIVDSTAENLRRYAPLWGSGYGSYYTDRVVPIPPYVPDSFPEYSLESGLFYRCHGYVIHTMFKYGLIGFLIMSSLWMIPAWECLKHLRSDEPGPSAGIIACLVAFMFTGMLQMSWSAKGYVLNGALIAMCMTMCTSAVITHRRAVDSPTS